MKWNDVPFSSMFLCCADSVSTRLSNRMPGVQQKITKRLNPNRNLFNKVNQHEALRIMRHDTNKLDYQLYAFVVPVQVQTKFALFKDDSVCSGDRRSTTKKVALNWNRKNLIRKSRLLLQRCRQARMCPHVPWQVALPSTAILTLCACKRFRARMCLHVLY